MDLFIIDCMSIDTIINNKNIKDGLISGINGSSAVLFQVSSLMWLKTITNYQYVHGTNILQSCSILYKKGGIPRFYRGLFPSLLITPITRFGDISTNTFCLNYFGNEHPIWQTTMISSILAGSWRIFILPIENWKTSKQVYGKDGYKILKKSVKKNGITELYKGGLSYFGYSVVGTYGWFTTFNLTKKYFPIKKNDTFSDIIIKSTGYGVSASIVSDIMSNSLRIIKTVKQTEGKKDSYNKIVKNIIKKEGNLGILKRGLFTSLIGNSIQASLFSIIFIYLSEKV